MKHNNILCKILGSAAMFMTAFAAMSCDDEIVVGTPDQGNYEIPDSQKEIIYIADKEGKREFSTVEFRNNGSVTLRLYTPGNVNADCQVRFTYDPSVLAEYNAANGQRIYRISGRSGEIGRRQWYSNHSGRTKPLVGT